MADKFGLGKPSTIVKALGHFPGQIYSVLGPTLQVPGVPASAYAYGFGEIVKIVDNHEGAYSFRAVTTSDTAVALAVVKRDQVGGTDPEANVISKAKSHLGVSLFLLSEEQHASIAVPCGSATSVAVGSQVYVGLGTNGKVAGSTYGASDSTHTLTLTGYEFKTLPFKPSDTDALVVIIGKKLDI